MQSLTTGSVMAAKPVSRIINPDLGFHLVFQMLHQEQCVCVWGGRGCRCACQHVYVWV